MEIDFEETMAAKSTDSLLKYVEQRMKYVPKAVEIALETLGQRGHVYSAEELTIIRQDIEKRRKQLEDEEKAFFDKTFERLDKNVVEDTTAPLLYSKMAINSFSIIINPLFGAALLAINLKETGRSKAAARAIFFGLLYFTIEFLTLTNITVDARYRLPFFINALGAYLLYEFFWNKYLGKETKYRKKPIWIPLGIAAIISIFVIYIVMSGIGT